MWRDRLQRAFAEVARLVAVAQFHRFMLAGGCAGGHGRASHAAVGEVNIRFHGRVAARIQNLSSNYFYDRRQSCAPNLAILPMSAAEAGLHATPARSTHDYDAAFGDVIAARAVRFADRSRSTLDSGSFTPVLMMARRIRLYRPISTPGIRIEYSTSQ